MRVPVNNIDLANHRIIYRDFEGDKSESKGFSRKRSFLVALDPEEAERMADEGWPVKMREPRNEEEDRMYFITVNLTFGGKTPPKIVVLNPMSKRKKTLDEHTIGQLNWIDILDVPQMIVRPFHWVVRGREGVSAYLNSLYVTKRIDPIEEKFADYIDEDEEDVD